MITLLIPSAYILVNDVARALFNPFMLMWHCARHSICSIYQPRGIVIHLPFGSIVCFLSPTAGLFYFRYVVFVVSRILLLISISFLLPNSF